MSFDALNELNWLAVLVSAIAYFVLGAAWYAQPVFGKAWQRSMGWEMPAGQRPNPVMFVAPLITCLIASIAIGGFAASTGTDTLGEGIVLGLFAGVGISAAVLFVTAIFEPTKPSRMTWFAVTAGYHLVGLLIASVIIALWE